MSDLTRREWLIQSLTLTGAAVAAQLPPQFSTPATPPCDPSTKPTPPRKTLAAQTGTPGVQLLLEGHVIGIRCGLLAGASVTAWIGGARTVVTTDANGRYKLHLALPNVAAPRVNLRVAVRPQADPTKQTTLTTFVFLPDEIARLANAKTAGFDPLLRMKLIKKSADAVQASFDVILDL